MERNLIEEKIRKIIGFMKNQNLSNLLERSISNFSDYELEKILKFLESGDTSLLINFIQEKTKDFMGEIQAIKFAKGKIKIGKNIRIEKKERTEELKEAEFLINQL